MLADGGDAISDIDVLRHQPQVLGTVASPATLWRALNELTPAALRIATARAKVHRHAWSQLPDGLPASQAVGSNLGDVATRDVDATIVVGHSEKESSAATVKASSGFIR